MRASVVARCDAAPVLELCEHVFPLVALLVGPFTVSDLLLAVLLGWDAGGNALIRDQGCRAGQVGWKHIRALEIAALAGGILPGLSRHFRTEILTNEQGFLGRVVHGGVSGIVPRAEHFP